MSGKKQKKEGKTILKRNLKRLGVIIASITLIGVLPVQAARYNYGFNLRKGESKITSYATKAGDANFEDVYYVRQTFTATSQGTTNRMYYYSTYNGNIVSNALYLRSDDFESHFNSYYSGSAYGGREYGLKGVFATSSGSSHEDVSGVWTP